MRYFSSEVNDEVLLETVKGKGIITLNRPKALNALNLSMIRTIYPQLKEWEKDPSVKLVVIKGAGGKAFCAGGDVVALTEAGKTGDPLAENFTKEEYILNNAIGTMSTPYVALIHGITMGGGVGLSVHGRFRVATEKTLFAMPETKIGFFPDVGGSYFLSRLDGTLGIYLALTGTRLKGLDVKKAGIATHFVNSDMLPALEQDLLEAESPDLKTITTTLEHYQDQALSKEGETDFSLEPHIGQINKFFGCERMEEIFQHLEADGSEWALRQLDIMRKMSPTSLKVTLKQIIEGARRSMQHCFQMEYRLSQRFLEDNDFTEGVRAVLVDKDNNPTWSPDRVEDVSDEHVASYFSSLPLERELILERDMSTRLPRYNRKE